MEHAPDGAVSPFTAMGRLLTFRSSREEISAWGRSEFLLGAAATWLAGLGRTWDWTSLPWHDRLGAGSLGYVFLLAFVLWVVVAPWKIDGWSYRRVLIFVMFTAPPALLYAFPVERLAAGSADSYNAAALFVVSAWRISLLLFFLRRFAGLTRGETAVATMLPVCGIVGGLTFFNFATGVIEIMGGFHAPLPNDLQNALSMVLTALFFWPFWGFLVAFFVITRRRRRGPGLPGCRGLFYNISSIPPDNTTEKWEQG